MLTPIFWRVVRPALIILFFAQMVLLSSCTENNGEEPEPEKPDPSEPLPTTLCGPNVIEGYTDKVSYAPDEEVTAFLQSNSVIASCKLTIYHVNGEEAFSIASALAFQTVNGDQPSANGFGFVPTVKFKIPEEVASGVYMIEKKIPFVVRTSKAVDLMIVYASNTANAYATSGGKSLYTPPPNKPSQVSFHRPIPLEAFSGQCLKWFEGLSGFSMGYVVDSDLDYFERIKDAKTLVIIGHNEYWTRAARLNFDRFVDEGGDALILSGNTMWWQVRYADDGKTLLCYKDVEDPETNPLYKTKTWDNPMLDYSITSSIGADFPRGGYGVRNDQGWNGYKIVNKDSPLFDGLNLTNGQIISCPTVEWDGVPIASFDANGYPVVDNDILNFDQIELLAFDRGFRAVDTYGTFIVFRRKPTSGVVINTASTDWCSSAGMGGTHGDMIKKITLNALTKLKNGETVFTEE
jgi:hypothetical protein